ncbi:MAG: 30S ribosomal protein S16 [Lachnospiraceae bacterium]|nr:30S ribosomal protein S16 [Lachnospiraceae bacterium]
MVKIRLTRIGKKKMPFYKIVVSDSRNPVDGRFIEQIGTYDPNTNPSTVKIDQALAQKWLTQGAQPTETVAKLMRQAGIGKKGESIEVKVKAAKPKKTKAQKAKAEKAAEAAAAPAAAEAAPAEA